MGQSVSFEAARRRRTFRKCPACGAEWPDSREYCRRCGVWIGSSDKVEDLWWFLPKEQSLKTHDRNLSNGVFEATVLSIACCFDLYSTGLTCRDLLSAAFREITKEGGIPGRGPQGHLVGFFIDENLADAAHRAAELALALRVRAVNDRVRTFLGLNTGPIVAEGGNISGGVLAYAETLSFSLQPNMVVIGPSTFRLISSFYDCYGTGPLGLWGGEGEVSTTLYVLSGPKALSSWRHQLDDDAIPLIGREDELNRLCQWWEECKSDTRSCGSVHVIGDPGSGKSKLVQAFLRRIKESDPNARAVKLAGFNYGSMPGLLVREFIAECAKEDALAGNPLNREVRVEVLERNLPESIAKQVRLVSQEVSRLRTQGPFLIVIDDIHWADEASIKVFQKAFKDIPAGVMVIVSSRPSGLRLAKVLHKAEDKRIRLGPLRQREAKRLSALHRSHTHVFSEALWTEIWNKSKGNPLYVEEATKLLTASGGDSSEDLDEDFCLDHVTLPDTLAGLIVARMQKWADLELLQLRSELHLQWGGSHQATLSRIEKQINDWLDRLETQRYLERNEIAQCLYELEGFQDRIVELCLVGGLARPLTTRLGEAISRLYDGSYKEYYQFLNWSSSDPRNRSWAGNQALRAARRDYQKGRLHQAVRFYRFAEGMIERDNPLRRDLLENAADIHFILGRTKEAARFYEEALKEMPVHDLHSQGMIFRFFAARILSRESGDLSSSQWPRNLPEKWCLLLATLKELLSGDPNTAAFYAEKAKAASRDWVTKSCSLLGEAMAGLLTGNPAKARARCKELVEGLREGGVSLFSLGLHWILSQAEEGFSQAQHRNVMKFIAKRMGVTPGRAVSPLLWQRTKDPVRRGCGRSLPAVETTTFSRDTVPGKDRIKFKGGSDA